MKTIELQVEDDDFERARAVAQTRQLTLEALLERVVAHLGEGAPPEIPFLGMFADEPELIDAVVESAMRAREQHPLRAPRE